MYIIYIEADSETASTDDSMDSTIEDLYQGARVYQIPEG